MPVEHWKDPNEPRAHKRIKHRYRAPFGFDPTEATQLDRLIQYRRSVAQKGDAKALKAADVVIAYATGERSGNALYQPTRHWPIGSADLLDLAIFAAILGEAEPASA